MMNKIVVLDVDGVVLRYDEAYTEMMLSKGYVKTALYGTSYDMKSWFDGPDYNHIDMIEEFNNSDLSSRIEPYEDMVKCINGAYKNLGVHFAFVTKFGTTAKQKASRITNLERHIACEAINRIVFVPMKESKKPYLMPWANKGLIFVEDCIPNAIEGRELGFDTYIHDICYARNEGKENGFELINGESLYEKIVKKHG